MYILFLSLHSLTRWLLLACLLFTIFKAYKGWKHQQVYTKQDNQMRHITATLAHIQLVIGLWLYFTSPIIHYFLSEFKDAVHQREVRFFGMEHSLVMLVAIALITVGSSISKRKKSDANKFRTVLVWYTIALLIILVVIPWPFSPIAANRPYYRAF